MSPSPRPAHRRPRAVHPRAAHARGAVTVEIAFGFLILGFVLAAAIHFGDAMVVRQRLTLATSRGARVCAPRGADGVQACAEQQVRAALGQMLLPPTPRCDPLNVTTEITNPGGISIVTVRATCRYTGGIAQIVRRFAQESRVMGLSAQSTMPLSN